MNPENKHFDFQKGQKKIADDNIIAPLLKTEQITKLKVAHEIGHLIGLVLNDECVEPFVIAKSINLGKERSELIHEWTDDIFKVRWIDKYSDFYDCMGHHILTNRYEDDNHRYLKRDYCLT